MIRALPARPVGKSLWQAVLLVALIATLFAVSATRSVALAQSVSASAVQPVRATLEVTVVDARTDDPLAYAVVVIAQIGIEHFTDSRGRLMLPAVAPGTYGVTVRRLGFTPAILTVTIAPGSATNVPVRMERIAQQLSRMRVTAAHACANPGTPDVTSAPEVFMLVSLLRENADRYRLLATQYPFVSVLARALGDLRDEATYVERFDIQTIPSRTRVNYRPGRVVNRRENQYSMGLPTILDLADDGFVRSHCFFYGGATTQSTATGEETWLRLDVRADDKLNSPDVHGSFYLDSATAQLRKMDLELSRPDKLPRQLASVASVQVSTAFVEIASGLAVIESVCAITHFVPSTGKSDSLSRKTVPVELQQLSNYSFSSPPPDVPVTRTFAAPGWEAGIYLPRSAVWCEASPS